MKIPPKIVPLTVVQPFLKNTFRYFGLPCFYASNDFFPYAVKF